MTRSHVAAALALALLFGALAPAQDLIRLKTGAVLEGAIIEQDEKSVTIAFDGGSMELSRGQIAEIKVARDPGRAAAKKSLLTLSRFSDHDSFHFLYRNGKRVGYRTISMRREAREGVPGYALDDRLVFMPRPGAQPDVDLAIGEFVDAELNPIAFSHRMSSGRSGRLVSGSREGQSLVMKERRAGRLQEGTALFRREVQFPGMLLRRLASQPPPEGAYPIFRVFRPRDVNFGRVGIERRVERITLRGRIRDVLVLRRLEGAKALETWLDMSGHIIREELGSTRLVSLSAPKLEVMGYARGDDVPEGQDLGLEFIHEPTGFRALRPDLAWEVTPGETRGVVVSMLRPGLRATVDVLHLDDVAADATEEGVAMKVIACMERHSEDLRVEGPHPARIGDRKGLRFEAGCVRRGTLVRTLAAILLDDRGHAFVILCAAPEAQFYKAHPAFIEMLEAVRVLGATTARLDPFDAADADVGGK